MGWIRNLIDQGKFLGVAPGSFYPVLFLDAVHPNVKGGYLVDLTWYAAFYGESPEGKVLPVGTGLTAEQAAVMQRLAWDVVKNYPDCGLYEEGTDAGRQAGLHARVGRGRRRNASDAGLRDARGLVPLHAGRHGPHADERLPVLRRGERAAGDDAQGRGVQERHGGQSGRGGRLPGAEGRIVTVGLLLAPYPPSAIGRAVAPAPDPFVEGPARPIRRRRVMARQFLIGRHRGAPALCALVLLAGGGLILPGAGRAAAADAEVRDFVIQVDGKPAGDYHMTIRSQDDGSVSMSAESDVHVAILLVNVYSYSYRGREVWKQGRLQHFESAGKENGKAFAVSADLAGGELHVKANGQESVLRPDVCTTSCWQLPDAHLRTQSVPLMGCDNGQLTMAAMQHVGSERLKVAGQELACEHYRLMRDVAYDQWYDAQERLVKQEWVSNGHRTVLELVRVSR